VSRPKLSDLSPEDRARLAEQARRENVVARRKDAAAKAMRRRERMAGLLTPRDHLRGCPELAGQGRVEWFAARKPPTTSPAGAIVEPAREVTVIRCLDCGGQVVVDRPLQDVIDQQEADR
jgi:hypothetical protein